MGVENGESRMTNENKEELTAERLEKELEKAEEKLEEAEGRGEARRGGEAHRDGRKGTSAVGRGVRDGRQLLRRLR